MAGTYTVDDIMALEPCAEFPRQRVEALWAGRSGLTLREIISLDIPAAARAWAAWRLLPEGPRMQALMATLTRAITEDVLHCGVPAVETRAARWLDGTDVSEASAWAAAEAAAAASAVVAAVRAEAAVQWAQAAVRAEAVQWVMGWAPTPTEYNRQLDDILAALGE